MPKHSNSYTFAFATAVCFVCSFFLAFVSTSLLSRQQLNVEVDMKQNILKAVNLRTSFAGKTKTQDILDIYKLNIEEIVIDNQGHVVKDKKPIDIDLNQNPDWMPLYVYKDGGKILSYCYPISGKGLWSTLYGYLAIEPDAKTVRGISFYKHGETPGLGGEIEKDWFQNNFKGKLFWNERKSFIQPIIVVKGKVKDFYHDNESKYYVDGISGATITSRGVTNLLSDWIHRYEPFFKNIRDDLEKNSESKRSLK